MRRLAALTAALVAPLVLAAPAHADSVLVCSPGAGVATTNTSCPFATSVHDAYFRQGQPAYPVAVSPVTGQVYTLSCQRGLTITMNQWPWNTANAVRCTGGVNAVVWLWST